MSNVLIVTLIVGAVLGRIAAGWAAQVLVDIPSTKLAGCAQCDTGCSVWQRWFGLGAVQCRRCSNRWSVHWPMLSVLTLAMLSATYAWLLTAAECQNVTEVQPGTAMHLLRLPFHLVFLFLLTAATLTDLLDYVIPDEFIVVGIVAAVLGATFSGDLQIIHVWVNWDAQIPGLEGPYLPEWMKHHHHLHGLAWSLAGMTVGATFIWAVRGISGWILGQPAMGFGDVTLMAMIGAFMGWQPALCAITIAPVTAIVVGSLVRVITGRTFVAFGPYLVVSAVIVLCAWRWIWAKPLFLRDVFSHWPSILGLVGGALVTLAVLLGGLRMFLSMPTDSIRR
jgi:leader peptidase (prepilin peptidase)/N-methyltransferase